MLDGIPLKRIEIGLEKMKDDIRKRSKSTSAMPDVRLAVTGGPRVGKSAISVRFLTRRFIGEYQRNVDRVYRRNIQFGSEVIEYDLKDMGFIRDNGSILKWATCIAVIYSITDRTSFTMATTILNDINTMLHVVDKTYQSLAPCLALIGNKRDLEHLREISNEEGKEIAQKYGAGFWEVSASDDYNSTFGPLNGLIVESYLNVVTAKNTDCNSNPSTGGGKKGQEETKLRARSENSTLTSSNRSSIDSELEDYDSKRKFGYKKQDDDTASISSVSSLKDSKKKKKASLELHLKKADNEKPKKKFSVGKYSLDSFPLYEDNSNMDSQSVEEDVFLEQIRSNSWSKKDKKRSSNRKSTENKSATPKLIKSRSYSDLKSLEKEQENAKDESSPLTRVKKLANEIDKHGGYKERNEAEQNLLTPAALLSPGEKPMTSSFSKLTSYSMNEIAKSVKASPKPRRERKNVFAGSPLDENDNENSVLNNNFEIEKVPMKLKRNEQKKSVRRKLSAIFRPKFTVETV